MRRRFRLVTHRRLCSTFNFEGRFRPFSDIRTVLQTRVLARDRACSANFGRSTPCARCRQPLQRTNISLSTCIHCGGTARIVAGIEEPNAMRAILGHFAKHGALEEAQYRPRPRGPPAVAMAA